MSGSRLRLSLNEVDVCLRKAALGVGLPVGFAEDLGAAAAWLCRWGFDGIGASVASLEAAQARATGPGRLQGRTLRAEAAPLAAWHAGPTACDLLRGDPGVEAGTHSGDEATEFEMPEVERPLLLLGAFGGYSDAKGPGLALAWEGGRALCRNGVPYLLDGTWESLERSAIGRVSAAVAGPRTQGACRRRLPVLETGIEVDAGVWARVQALVRLTLVPASDSSRTTGAGAGLVDTD